MKRVLYTIAIITFSLFLTSCSPQKVISNKEEANKQNLIIAVGPMGDKKPKTVNQGDIIELVETYKGEYAEFPIVVDTTSPKGISSEQDSISIKCNTDWGICEGTKPGGDARNFHVSTTKNKEAKFTIEQVLDNDSKNILSEPMVFYVKIKNNDNSPQTDTGKSIESENEPITNESGVFELEEQISNICESLNAVPVAWSPDKKRIAVTTTARTWIDTYIVDAETGKVSETDIFKYITKHAARYDFRIGKNARPDPYIQWIEWSPDSEKVLLSYSFTDDLYTRQTGVTVFDLDKQAIDWMFKLLPAEGEHALINKPEGFRWDSVDYGWKTGLISLDIENGEGVYNRKNMEEAIKEYVYAINTSDVTKLHAFTDPDDSTERFSNEALKTVLKDYETFFRGKNIVRYEFAGTSPYAEQAATYWLFNDEGRYKEVYFYWDSRRGYLSQDNFLYYSEYAKRLATAFTEALAKEDIEGVASVLTEDDLIYPKGKVPDIIRNFKMNFDLKTIRCKFEGNMDGEAGRGAFIYLIYGKINGLPTEHGIRVIYGDGLVALRDELIPSIQ